MSRAFNDIQSQYKRETGEQASENVATCTPSRNNDPNYISIAMDEVPGYAFENNQCKSLILINPAYVEWLESKVESTLKS